MKQSIKFTIESTPRKESDAAREKRIAESRKMGTTVEKSGKDYKRTEKHKKDYKNSNNW